MKNVKSSILLLLLAGYFLFAVVLGPSSQEADIDLNQFHAPTEAVPAFDNRTNGFLSQEDFLAFKTTFEKEVKIEEGLGPLFNATSCAFCHQTPVAGGSGLFTVIVAGHSDPAGGPGSVVIRKHALNPAILERVFPGYDLWALRATPTALGSGYVEAIEDNTLIDIAKSQPEDMRGQVIMVPLKEAPSEKRAGRFGWKCQHASLLSFSAEAYVTEQGVTSRLFPEDNFPLARGALNFDSVTDPEDKENSKTGLANIDKMTAFLRSTKPPPREKRLAASIDARAGEKLFEQIGCGICHVSSMKTAPAGTAINGEKFIVPEALGNKVIYPYSDFLLHDVGTGDGIVQNGGPATRSKLRTAPLWGLRTRARFMHDNATLTIEDAILRHANEAAVVVQRYYALTPTQKKQLLTFLRSL